MNKHLTVETLDLSPFTGTEQYFFNPLYKQMQYTDGVRYIAQECGAYWLLDIIGTEFFPKQITGKKGWEFLNIMCVATKVFATTKMTITVDDGNDNVLATKLIDLTDFPVGTVKMWMENNVLYLPSER